MACLKYVYERNKISTWSKSETQYTWRREYIQSQCAISSRYVAKITSAQLVFRTYPQQSKVVASPVYLDPNIPSFAPRKGIAGWFTRIYPSILPLAALNLFQEPCGLLRVLCIYCTSPTLPVHDLFDFGPKVLTSLSRPQSI